MKAVVAFFDYDDVAVFCESGPQIAAYLGKVALDFPSYCLW